MSEYQQKLSQLRNIIGGGLSWPEGEPLALGQPIPEIELPFVGPRFQADSLMVLLGDEVKSTPAELIPAGLTALKGATNAPLEFLLIAALTSVFLSRYGADVADRVTQQDLLESSAAGAEDRARLGAALDPIACGLISQPPGSEISDDEAQEFHDNWLKSILGAQLKILKPFYILVIGDQKEAGEIVSQALGCVAWSRETDQTAIGHLIALEESDLRHEVMFIKTVPSEPEELATVVEEFRRFIDGGFLLGREEFDLLQRR